MIRAVLDENVPRPLARLLRDRGLDVTAFRRKAWRGIANGRLLTLIEGAGYNVVITSDQSIPFQQNLAERAFGLIVLSRNDLATLAANLDMIVAAAGSVQVGSYEFVALKRAT